MILACHPGDCHYKEGNYRASQRHRILLRILREFGIEEERVRLEWVSASEGKRFSEVVDDMTLKIRELGPSKVRAALAADRAER